MAKKIFNETHQLAGVTKAIASLKKKRSGGPIWLLPSLERRRDELQAKLEGKSVSSQPSRDDTERNREERERPRKAKRSNKHFLDRVFLG